MFKRLLVLAVAMALFVTVFFVYFHVADAQIDNGFRHEREKFHAEGISLTAIDSSATPGSYGAPTAPAPVSSSATPSPAATAADASTNAPINPNALIGPVPPSTSSDSATPTAATPAAGATPDSSAAPDNSTTPTTPAVPAQPATPATNIPAAPASTFLFRGLNRLPFALLAAYDSKGQPVQTAAPSPTALSNSAPTTSSAPAPETNASTTPAPMEVVTPASSAGTNAAAAAPTTSAAPAPSPLPTQHGPVPVAASVIVLGYHQFTGPGIPSKNIYSMRQDVFDQEMKYLKDNNYHVVPLADVVRFIKHEIGLPPNSVAVTIDDGYKSAIVWAAPVLKKYGFPWTYFVYPDFITVAEGKGAASWNDLLQLQADGVDVECHSKSHPILTKKGGKTPEQYDAWLTAETAGAKATLEQHLGKSIKFFAYPYGAYNKEVEAKVIQAGFEAIFTVANNPVHPSTNIDAVGRYIITTPVEKAFASYLRQGALGVAEATPAPGATISDPRPMISAVIGYAGTLDPKTISTDVRDFGEVRHDFDPKTSTVRLYLPRDLIDSVVVVNIRAKDSGQTMIASWRFNYAPAAPAGAHPPISGSAPATPSAAVPPSPSGAQAKARPAAVIPPRPAAVIDPTPAAAHEVPIPSTTNASSSISSAAGK